MTGTQLCKQRQQRQLFTAVAGWALLYFAN
jgi:hypothetical protein